MNKIDEIGFQFDFMVRVLIQILEWGDVYLPSGKEPKYCFFNQQRMAIELYESDDIVEIDSIENIASILIKTTKIKTYLSIVKNYLKEGIPFNIIGPSGSGTRYAPYPNIFICSRYKCFELNFNAYFFYLFISVAAFC